LEVVWQNAKTGDAVFAVGARFIAAIGNDGTVFIDLLATRDARAALVQYRVAGYLAFPE
jgi:hypothetical protein